jgi:hypothetical protein
MTLSEKEQNEVDMKEIGRILKKLRHLLSEELDDNPHNMFSAQCIGVVITAKSFNLSKPHLLSLISELYEETEKTLKI